MSKREQPRPATQDPKRRKGPRRHGDRPLTKREQLFLAEYLKDLNGTKAATRAGYSRRTAGVTASKLLTKANVSAAVQSGFAERQSRIQVDADRVLRDIDAAANLDVGELFDEAGRLKSIHAMPPHVRRAIIAIEVVARRSQGEAGGVEYVHKIKTIDKGRMHELLARHVGLHDGASSLFPDVPAFALPLDDRMGPDVLPRSWNRGTASPASNRASPSSAASRRRS